jgi:hypothetical protein
MLLVFSLRKIHSSSFPFLFDAKNGQIQKSLQTVSPRRRLLV